MPSRRRLVPRSVIPVVKSSPCPETAVSRCSWAICSRVGRCSGRSRCRQTAATSYGHRMDTCLCTGLDARDIGRPSGSHVCGERAFLPRVDTIPAAAMLERAQDHAPDRHGPACDGRSPEGWPGMDPWRCRRWCHGDGLCRRVHLGSLDGAARPRPRVAPVGRVPLAGAQGLC